MGILGRRPTPSRDMGTRYQRPRYGRRQCEDDRGNMFKWVPEIHAILTQPRADVPLLKNWVHREGRDHVHSCKTLARDTWVQMSIDAGLS